ncbi:MAG: glycosyltransferase family 4 protein [Verrucomicrobiales bacterium]
MKVFLSAYACEPGKGSEPGVGWRWTLGLAERVELQVLTRESNREVIEAAVAAAPEGDPLRCVTFHYFDLPSLWLIAKKRGLLPTIAYYAVWQWAVAKRFGDLADTADFVHHLTFCTVLCPGFWKLKHAGFVLGPVGAPQVNAHYLPLFGAEAWKQRLRAGIIHRFLGFPWLRRLLRGAAILVPANSETRDLLVAHGLRVREVMLDTGAPDDGPRVTSQGQPGAIRLLYAGQLERRKGLELALMALAQVGDDVNWSLDLIGSGPDRSRLEQIVRDSGWDARVRFCGKIPRDEVMRRMAESDAFLFPSVRDTSGGVNLEAMASGLPVICIAHQGVGDITDESCAERIPPGPIDETARHLAEAISRFAHDPERRRLMGEAARERARKSFAWEMKFSQMYKYYLEMTDRRARE